MRREPKSRRMVDENRIVRKGGWRMVKGGEIRGYSKVAVNGWNLPLDIMLATGEERIAMEAGTALNNEIFPSSKPPISLPLLAKGVRTTLLPHPWSTLLAEGENNCMKNLSASVGGREGRCYLSCHQCFILQLNHFSSSLNSPFFFSHLFPCSAE